MKRHFLFIFIYLILAPSLYAEPIKIAAIFANTGRAADVGRDFFKAVRFAVEEVNNSGGLLKRKIKLLEFDNFSKPLNSKEAAIKAVEAGAVAVIGASWSSNSKAMAEVLQKSKIPMISPIATNPDVTKVGNYIFRICFTDPFQGKVMAKFAINDLFASTAAVFINVDSSFSQSLSREFTKSFKEYGGSIVYTGEYLKQDNNFVTQILNVLKLKPDVVYLSGYSRDSAFIIKQSIKMGVKTLFLGGDGWNLPMYKYGGKSIEGNYFTNHWHEDIPNDLSKKLTKKYAFFSNKGRLVLGYDATMLLIDSIRRASSIDPAKIRDAIASTTDFYGATGKITFDKNGDPMKPAVILRFSKGGTEFVKTVIP